MPWNGSGIFSRIRNWTNEAASGTPILPNEFDEQEQDFVVAGFGNCITRDGQGGPTADIPWHNFGITGLRAPVAADEAVNKAYVDAATGARSMGGFKITNLAVPTLGTDAANMSYVLSVAMNTALPLQSLGFLRSTGGGSPVASFGQTHTGYAQKEVKGADIVCAANINLSTATGNLVHVTGAVGPVTSITIDSGAEYTVIWDSTPTINHNAVSLILPSATNITVAAGDAWKIRGDGVGNARVVGINKADGTALRSAMMLLATLTPTAAANIDFLTTFTSAYDNYLIIGEGITVSANDQLLCRLAVAGSADAGSNYYTPLTFSTTSVTTSSTSGLVVNVNVSGGIGANFTMEVKNVNDAVRIKSFTSSFQAQSAAAPGYQGWTYSTIYNAANVVTGFRLFWNSGSNFGATGKVRVYGYNNS